MDELSEYELQRLEHIRRNHEMLVRLGLVDPTPAAPQQKAPRKPRTKLPPVPPESLRRSSRVRDLKPEYTKETIDQFGDDLDRQAARRSPAKKRPRPEEEDADEAALRREIDASTVAFLTEGAARPFSRLPSPSAERGPDPRPTAERPVSEVGRHRCISAFFAAYPTPSAFQAEVVQRGQVDALRGLVNSLGLFDDRLKSLLAITTAFLLPAEGEDAFAVDLKKREQGGHKIHGVGEFGWHSWLIFCRDMGATLKLEAGWGPYLSSTEGLEALPGLPRETG
ncbi:hypothetical protein EMIHUDRAFT_110939 [Emiliania huxleyi CCMP1516]|uniref:Uncharacterized protein n=2 Tax=Emiliania huxleyi TaxID=2903 RepID=A0A0D3KH58_EMIH1|nr:hypothetical protein EMIHUDRAFT_110939 [Emiliania huxleyi CCMP1516]EOD35093.1 hypothetical protein EMIHUDRAFT_110939 [Emiliania huxleyi CCMP1516]|eukprot:XP_005787522.1 hypothetical protein EMIHUDRAFT_110939 [Emiliania huxleyi CCMP1516]